MNILTKKIFQPSAYLRYAIRLLNQIILPIIDNAIAPAYEEPIKYPPIFFLGAPRSGSTLMFQVVTDTFDVGYISNAHSNFFGSPAFAEFLLRPTKNKQPSNYQSNYGVSDGPSAPSECGSYWYRFFRKQPAYVSLGEEDASKMRCFRRSVAALTKSMGRPVIFKNLYATLRIRQIAQHIPEALFIVTERNLLDNAHSILEARFKRFGDYAPWFSVPPPNWEKLSILPPEQQVVEQILHIHTLIKKDIAEGQLDSERFLFISYENFCNDVYGEIKKIDRFLRQWGIDAKPRFNTPPSFDIQNGKMRIDPDLFRSLQNYVHEKNTVIQ